MTTREIPDGPEGDHRFLCIVTVDAYGKPTALQHEIRKVIERLLYDEFGRTAKLTSITRTAYSPEAQAPTSNAYGTVVNTSDTDDVVVED